MKQLFGEGLSRQHVGRDLLPRKDSLWVLLIVWTFVWSAASLRTTIIRAKNSMLITIIMSCQIEFIAEASSKVLRGFWPLSAPTDCSLKFFVVLWSALKTAMCIVARPECCAMCFIAIRGWATTIIQDQLMQWGDKSRRSRLFKLVVSILCWEGQRQWWWGRLGGSEPSCGPLSLWCWWRWW